MKLLAKGLRLLNADKPTQKVAEILWGPCGPIHHSTMDDKCAVAQRLADCHNACVGIPDPAAALTAAREALEWCADLVEDHLRAMHGRDYEAGNVSEDNPFMEGLQQARAALAALKGEQP